MFESSLVLLTIDYLAEDPGLLSKKSKNLRAYFIFRQLEGDMPTTRLLFRKTTQRFDERDGLLAKAQLQIQALAEGPTIRPSWCSTITGRIMSGKMVNVSEYNSILLEPSLL